MKGREAKKAGDLKEMSRRAGDQANLAIAKSNKFTS
jgi:hypothetical protein